MHPPWLKAIIIYLLMLSSARVGAAG